PDEVQTLAPSVSSDTQFENWRTEADNPDHGYYIAEHCLRLPGLELDTVYRAVISGVDVFGRAPADHTVTFNSDGAPGHAGLELQPVGQNLLLVTTPHTPAETVDTRAFLVPYDAAPTCSSAEGGP